MSKDRRTRVAESLTRNGIDFVEVRVNQTELVVHLLNKVDPGVITREQVAVTGGDVIPTVALSHDPVADLPNRKITLTVAAPGDFSEYTLTIDNPKFDPYFASAQFSFKANCEAGFDCRTPDGGPPSPPGGLPPIDYLAKDYLSFRQALLDFSAARFPGPRERSSADLGVMLLETLCAVADDLSYLQDRVHNESSLEFATERVSVTRLARMVDYEPRPATAARAWLRFAVDADTTVPAGLPVTARMPDGRSLPFEVGEGLRDKSNYPLRANRTLMTPHLWDAGDRCLRAGARELWIRGKSYAFQAGDRLLIETKSPVAGSPPIREWVRLAAPEAGDEIDDPLPETGPNPVPVTRLRFAEPTQHDHDLQATTVHGNIVPATQGRTVRGEIFFIPGDTTPPTVRQAIWRTGPRGDDGRTADQYLHTLATEDRVAWLGPDGGGQPVPEVLLSDQTPDETKHWTWRSSLLKADRFEKAFTLDPVRYRRITNDPDRPAAFEYDGEGDTIRFGYRGLCEVPTADTRFDVVYRVADGAAGNVPADTITGFDPVAAAGVKEVSNPFPATGGDDAESLTHIRDHAPQAFRVEKRRAVRPEDYRRAAEELEWVQRAGATFRWTGSWLTGFVAVDPVGGREPSVPQSLELTRLLNRRRLAGYEIYVVSPRYVALDIHLEVCAAAESYAGHVDEAVRRAVASTPGAFFDPDHFTFGGSLRRSELEDAVQRVPGVGGVVCIRFRRRGQTAYQEMPDEIAVGVGEIIQVASDPNRPDRGRVDVVVRGGR